MLRTAVSWMGWRLAGFGIAGLRWGMKTVKTNRRLYSLAYSLRNSQEFSDLYEHEKMLADQVRVAAYAEGIRRAVRPGQVVVDLGTGSGILSILAARQGAKVYAIDHSDFIALAKENARRNGIEGITFVRANSRNYDPPEKADILLHEQIGDNLFNENMVENLLELKQRVLKPGGRILPGRFHLFMEPVALHPEFRVPFMEEIKVQGIDFSYLARAGRRYCSASYGKRSVERAAVAGFLGEPSPILTVDLNEIRSADAIPAKLCASRRVTHPGQMDGIYQYFGISFDEEVQFDTSPFSTRTHWANRLFRTPQRSFAAGDTIDYALDIGDLALSDTWSVAVTTPAPAAPAAAAGSPVELPGTA